MDGNKDESERCINIALKAKSLGDVEKAKKFLGKALRLYPTKRAADLLASLEKPTSNGEAPHSEGAESTKPRQRQNSHSKSREDENKENKVVDYTPEQLAAVKRINGCSDLYEVLELSKEFTDSELKKAYRKWALQMHPDKNKAPGATEAFKAVGKAYGVLSDKDKKKQYDLYGPEMQPSRPSHDHDEYSHGFEGDISPEELFNMFFGGGFSSGHVHRRQHHQARRTYYTYREPQQSESGLTLFFQLAPILLLVVLSMLSSFLVSDAVFSLQRTDKYRVEKTTSNLRVTYFVKDEFRPEFKSELRRIERAVEEEYIGQLRSNCFRERNYKENMMWRARNYGDAKLYQRAVDMATPSCDNLQKVYS